MYSLTPLASAPIEETVNYSTALNFISTGYNDGYHRIQTVEEKEGHPKSTKQLSWPVASVVVERKSEVNTHKSYNHFSY